MNFLRNLPLKRKLTLISMLTSGVAVLLTCAVIIAYEQVSFRHSMVKDLTTTAKMVADNSAAALTFNDPASAEQTLRSLSADRHIVAAFVYDSGGQLFARYQPPGAAPLPLPPVEKNLSRFHRDSLDLFRDISVAGETIGTIYLRHDMVELHENLERFGLLVLGVIGATLLVALLLTRRLQDVVAAPIMDLAQVVCDVAAHQDFSLRAVKQGSDEVGRLIDGFNEMLGQIQHRDAALQAAQHDLEKRVAERTQELASSLSILNATLESTADGILAVQSDGQVLGYNTKFATMWGIPTAVMERRDVREITAFSLRQVKHAEQFLQHIDGLHGDHDDGSFDVIELTDGRIFERSGQPQKIAGQTVGMVFDFRDVTERKRAEEELETMHKQLLQTSHQAGMAEVATNVLHNVGNVLNSVNVSAALVTDGLKKSKVTSLARVVALLEEHAADLGDFVSRDPQGKNLPVFLRQLCEQLTRERRSAGTELESLRENIDHIKDIVAMQQNYAKVSGVSEVLRITDLVEDSLRMNAGALVRHEVQVVRDYEEAPAISVEKHKVLQILVNLIRNAKYACDEGGRPDKQVTLRVVNGEGTVKISVIDNGVGIPPENLVRIFNHGFTTRKDGHGFGLHGGAIAARELGGFLTVHSAGPGCGAIFTLELPVNAQEPARKGDHRPVVSGLSTHS